MTVAGFLRRYTLAGSLRRYKPDLPSAAFSHVLNLVQPVHENVYSPVVDRRSQESQNLNLQRTSNMDMPLEEQMGMYEDALIVLHPPCSKLQDCHAGSSCLSWTSSCLSCIILTR